MNKDKDISNIIKDWEYLPGQLSVRLIIGDNGKVGIIMSEILWVGYKGKSINRPKDAPKWAVIFDGENEQKPKHEDELEIL